MIKCDAKALFLSSVISGNMSDILFNVLSVRKQALALNKQTSAWKNINAGVHWDYILWPLLLLIYGNNWSGNLLNSKLFADDILLFQVTHAINTYGNEIRI